MHKNRQWVNTLNLFMIHFHKTLPLPTLLSITALLSTTGFGFDQFSGSNFLYMDRADRTALVDEICGALRDNYSFWNIKKTTIRINPEQICKDAHDIEAASADPQSQTNSDEDQLKLAIANLEFQDRLEQLAASFQDTHLGIRASIPRSMMYLPFELAAVGNEFRVTRVAGNVPGVVDTRANPGSIESYEELISGATQTPLLIQKGDRVLSIDGLPIEVQIQRLLPHVGSSSPAARRVRVIRALTARSFMPPSRSTAVIEYQRADKKMSIELPWYYRGQPRVDQALFFKSIGILDRRGQSSGWKGFAPSGNLPQLQSHKLYVDSPEDQIPVLESGIWVSRGKRYGVLKVASFDSNLVYEQQGYQVGADPVSFIDTLKSMIGALALEGVPLIVDLRFNGGGNGKYPSMLASWLRRQNSAPLAPMTKSYRLTRANRMQFQERFASLSDDDLIGGARLGDYLTAVRRAVDTKAEYFPAFIEKPSITDLAGYPYPVVALIGPECISACDKTAAYLKAAGVPLIGQPTNGTGGGFGSDDFFETDFTDSRKFVRFDIPNTLFGLQGGSASETIFERKAALLNIENKPTQPDYAYEDTWEGIVDGDVGILEKAASTLRHLERTPKVIH